MRYGFDAMRKERDEARADAMRLSCDVDVLKSDVEAARAERETALGEAVVMDHAADMAEMDRDRAREHAVAWKRGMRDERQHNAGLRATIENMGRELDQARAELRITVDATHRLMSEHERHVASLREKMSAAFTSMSEACMARGRAEGQVEGLRMQLGMARERADLYFRKCAELDRDVAVSRDWGQRWHDAARRAYKRADDQQLRCCASCGDVNTVALGAEPGKVERC
jgi:chromosome segregation ATPase